MYGTDQPDRSLRHPVVLYAIRHPEPLAGALPPPASGHPADDGALDNGIQPFGGTRFFQLYQVDVGDEDNETEDTDLSQDEKGVKGHFESSHSPFGLIYQIAKDTGWSLEYIRKIPYATLIMMLSDAPRYISKKEDKPIRITSKEQMFAVFGKKGG